MANKTEYVFEKDFWGNWKLVPKNSSDNGLISIAIFVLVLIATILCFVLITLPLCISLLGFKMVKSKRHYAGVGSILALILFIIDIQNKWLTGFLFLGYIDSTGKFTEGLINDKIILLVYVLNAIGILLGFVFIAQSFLYNKQKINISFNESKKYLNSTSSHIKTILISISFILVFSIIYLSIDKKTTTNEFKENKKEYTSNTEKETTLFTQNSSTEIIIERDNSEKNLLNLVAKYYDDVWNDRLHAQDYFSNNVKQYVNEKNISPIDINNIHNNNREFISIKCSIIDDKIEYDRTEGTTRYYKYWIKFYCYRVSKKKHQNCKINVEIGLDNKSKINSYIELEVTDLTFTSLVKSNTETPHNDLETVLPLKSMNYIVKNIENKRAHFHDSPNPLSKKQAYLINGDEIYVQKIEDGYGYIEYTNFKGKTTYGWLDMNDLTLKNE